jgi:oligoribonuclease
MTDKPTKLIWLDIETTGLDPRHDLILEIAAFETDFDEPFAAHKIYEAVLPFHGEVELTPLVQDMHTKNGLLEVCRTQSTALHAVEDDLMKLLPDGFEYVMAGSSVHFDHSFIHAHMPAVSARFSHRHYDVSAVKLFAQSLGMPKFPKAEAHRAAADVLESIEHAKKVAEWFSERGAGSANGADVNKFDKFDAARWRTLVQYWRESDNPTDIANSIPDLLGASADQLEEGVRK